MKNETSKFLEEAKASNGIINKKFIDQKDAEHYAELIVENLANLYNNEEKKYLEQEIYSLNKNNTQADGSLRTILKNNEIISTIVITRDNFNYSEFLCTILLSKL